MPAVPTATVNSFKQQLLQGAHCFQGALSQTGTTNTNTLITSITSTANLITGMAVTAAANVAANTYVAYVVNSTACEISRAATGSGAITLTFTADQFQIGLLKNAFTGTYDRTTSNYANVTTNSDENAGTGYTAGGFALVNLNPSVPDSNTAIEPFSTNPNWTSATITTNSAFIYNKGLGATLLSRIGATGNNMVSFHDFGGTQQVTGGTLTLTLPTANGTAALLRIS